MHINSGRCSALSKTEENWLESCANAVAESNSNKAQPPALTTDCRVLPVGSIGRYSPENCRTTDSAIE